MKKFFAFLWLSFSVFAFSQTYHFDYVMDYETHYDGETISWNKAINSKNHSYDLTFSGNDKKMYARILDLDRDVEHYFEVINPDFPLTADSFKYKNSTKRSGLKEQHEKELSRRFFSFEKKSEDKNTGEEIFIAKEQKSEKGRQHSAIAEVVLIPYKDDLASAEFVMLFDMMGFGKKNTLPQNYVLKEAVLEFDNKKKTFKLNSFTPQNFDLTIPGLKMK